MALDRPGAVDAEATSVLGTYLRDVMRANAADGNFRFFSPDETNSNKLGAIFEATGRAFVWPSDAPIRDSRATAA